MDGILTIKKPRSFKAVRVFWILHQESVSFFGICFFPPKR